MNVNARLDHLIDVFKHDVRALIQSAVDDEREKLVDDLRTFLGSGEKNPLVQVAESIEKSVDDVHIKPCGFCRRRGEPCVRHGGARAIYIPKKKVLATQTEPKQSLEELSDETPVSNRPLIDFVKKKDRTIELPDEKLNPGKNYADYLAESGQKVNKFNFDK